MASEGLGEMFEGDSADTSAVKFPLHRYGAEQRVLCTQTREQGPPSALAEIVVPFMVDLYILKSLVELFQKWETSTSI